MKRFLNSGMFGVAVLCFFLPFMNIKCNGAKIMTLSGVQMATGANVNPGGGGMFDGAMRNSDTSKSHDAFQVLLLIALIVFFAGCVTTLALTLKNKPQQQQSKLSIGFSAAALLCLLFEVVAMTSKLSDVKGGSDMMNISWHFDIGYWFVTLIAIGLIVYNVMELRKPATSPQDMFDDYNPAPPPPGMDV